MTKILINSITGVGNTGVYEWQLGNVAILIPTIKLLKQYIPCVKISTNIQLTEEFCTKHGISSIPRRREYLPLFNWAPVLILLLFDMVRASLWRLIRDILHINAKILIKSKRLNRFSEADIVLDFNGDIFPSDGGLFTILSQTIEVMTIHRLGIPIIEFVGSPGPFDTWLRRVVARLMYNSIDIFLNREEISSELLKQLGIKKPILTTACPAFLLEAASPERGKEILIKEGVDLNARPLVGFTMSGYNLPQRTWGEVKSFKDLDFYIPVLEWLLDELKANVVLIPHVYRTNPHVNEFELVNGPDHDILLNLSRMVDLEARNGKLKLIEGKYTTSEAKSVIGQFDMFISSRLHAGVAALSQGVPTVLLAYGNKHRGYARLVGQEKYAYDGRDCKALLSLIKEAWKHRAEIKQTILERMPQVCERVHRNFLIIKKTVELSRRNSKYISEERFCDWLNKL